MVQRTHNQNSLLFGNWNGICDECGFKFKGIDLKTRWDGHIVCRDCWETRHPSDFYRYIAHDNAGGPGKEARDDTDQFGTGTGTDIEGNPIPAPISIDAYTFPAQETGEDFAHQFTATGGTGFTWSVSAGALPTGVTLNPNTGYADGIMTTAESASWTLMITHDDGRTATRAFTAEVGDSWSDLIMAMSPAYFYNFTDNGSWATDALTNDAITATGVIDAASQVGLTQTSDATGGNNAASFDGSTSFMLQEEYTGLIDFSLTPTQTGWLSNEAIIYISPSATGNNTIAAKGPKNAAGSNSGWLFFYNAVSQALQTVIYGGAQGDNFDSNLVVPTGQWIYVASTHKPGQATTTGKIWVNGVSQGITKYGNDYASVSGDIGTKLRIGALAVETTGAVPLDFFQGKIDSVVGHGTELTQALVDDHYAASGL